MLGSVHPEILKIFTRVNFKKPDMTTDDSENISLSVPDCPKFKDQVFDDIKRSCLSEGTLWTDPEFAPSDVSLWGDNPPLISGVDWTRVGDVCEGARLFIEGSSVDTCTRCL